MKKTILMITLIGGMLMGYANNLVISNVTKVDNNTLSFDISWDNSWLLGDYHDAVYVFIKYKNTSGVWQHLQLLNQTGASYDLGGGFVDPVTFSNKGVIIKAFPNATKQTSGTITAKFDGNTLGPLPDFKVFGIEMVYVNPGDFYVGDGASTNRYYQGNDATLPYHITSENQIIVGAGANNIAGGGLSSGDTIEVYFPKGFNQFYIMKYEITQEQYVEFLNTLTPPQQQAHTETDLTTLTSPRYVMSNSTTLQKRNGIKSDGNNSGFYCDLNGNNIPNEATDGQNIACNLLSIHDLLAYLEWSTLSVVSSFQFEKAARGNTYPIPLQTAIGNNLTPTNVTGLNNSGGNNETVVDTPNTGGIANYNFTLGPIRVGCFATATSNRLQAGASFYGVMNLQANLAEMTFSPTSFFTNGYQGSGTLSANGDPIGWYPDLYDVASGPILVKTNHYAHTAITPVSDNSTFISNSPGIGDYFYDRTYQITVRGVLNF